MATMFWKFVILLLSFCSCRLANSQFIFDNFIQEEGCEVMCKNTYPLHTYEKSEHLGYCLRGCRLFVIIDFVNDCDNLNNTRDACAAACKEAYPEKPDQEACIVGCNAQLPYAVRKHQRMAAIEEEMLSPLMYVHSIYSNMIDKLSPHVSVRWSFYIQPDDSGMVVIKSDSSSLSFPSLVEGDDDGEYKTSNYLETNLESVDNSATPNLKRSQVAGALERQVRGTVVEEDGVGGSADWLSCVSKKTGIPRLLLSLTIFVSAMVMIWLCVSTTVTAPEHRIHSPPQQKLSIYGDLEYLREIDDKALLAAIHPQDCNSQAGPLPIKVKVERI